MQKRFKKKLIAIKQIEFTRAQHESTKSNKSSKFHHVN